MNQFMLFIWLVKWRLKRDLIHVVYDIRLVRWRCKKISLFDGVLKGALIKDIYNIRFVKWRSLKRLSKNVVNDIRSQDDVLNETFII